MIKKVQKSVLLIFLAAAFTACNSGDRPAPAVDVDLYTTLQERLINAQPGEVIEIPEGTFHFDRSLSLEDVPNVTIRGAGKNKTFLSFKGQQSGAEGIKVTADSVTIRDLTIQDTKGDAIKLLNCRGVTLINVHTTWTDGAKGTNGAYGLYPVSCQNVLIDSCEASFASDAGIYVGQSQDVVVRNSYAHDNVAGIEIENCTRSEVYQNLAKNNTGGILVFDLPGLPAGNGHSCRIYRNRIEANNHDNFAPEGNMVAIVPPGSGLVLLAAKGVEVFENEIIGHKTVGASIASYHITQLEWSDSTYNPFTYDVYLHDNLFERKSAIPDLSKDLGKLVNMLFMGKPQDILYDGILDESRGNGPNPMGICIREKSEDLRFSNIDAAHDFKQVKKDLKVHDCELVVSD